MLRLTRALMVCACAAVLVATAAERAAACSCVASPTFDEEARRAPIVLVGRVMEIGDLKPDEDRGSIVLDVERTLKGAVQSSTVKVWNEAAGSSCGGTFSKLVVGSSIALVVVRVSDVENPSDMWAFMDFHPPASDLLVRLGCGQPLKVFASDQERDRWLRRRRF